jgi:hypothetical protein
MEARDNRVRYAFATFLFRNDHYVPGALVLAYALRRQRAGGDLVVLVTQDVPSPSRALLGLLFDHVLEVADILIPYKDKQRRQHIPYVFGRLHALRLGRDGDLGHDYDKVVLMDADLLPLKDYRRLVELDCPAGIINEKPEHFVETDEAGNYVIPPHVDVTGRWKWHSIYDAICPHGAKIPHEITDRVKDDPTNLGVHTCLQVLAPSFEEYCSIRHDLESPEILPYVSGLFRWPDMQYLTMRWSGRWTNIDVRFAGLNGYPKLSVLNGTHFGGVKPWQYRKEAVLRRWGRREDFRKWFQLYLEMVEEHRPELLHAKRLAALRQFIRREFPLEP